MAFKCAPSGCQRVPRLPTVALANASILHKPLACGMMAHCTVYQTVIHELESRQQSGYTSLYRYIHLSALITVGVYSINV